MSKKFKERLIFVVLVCALLLVAVFYASCATSSSDKGGDYDYSKTNNQEAEVDEGDVVKVAEGGYIYKAQSDGLTVSRADTEGGIEIIKKEAYLSFIPSELFVYNKYLIIMGTKIEPVYDSNNKVSHYEKGSEIKIYDLETIKDPEDEREAELRGVYFRGTYYTSRINDGFLYVAFRVLNSNETEYTNKYIDSLFGEKSFGKNRYANKNIKGGYILAAISLSRAELADVKARYYNGENVKDIYFSPYAIYAITETVTTHAVGGCSAYQYSSVSLSVVKISNESLDAVDSIDNIYGSILNRYSLYDDGQYFFMVEDVGNGARLTSYDKDLVKIDSLPDFGRGERLYAVRFDGGFCYAVTYRTVDPLYKIDISTPYNMRMLGELKIDDFSTHLQPFGTDKLIGVGFETDIRFSPKGLKISLFDTESGAPIEINSLRFGDTSSSTATYDPRAILCEPDRNIFAIPANYAGSHGAMILGVNEEGLLVKREFLPDKQTPGSTDNYAITMRIIRIGGFIYTISDAYISSYSIETLEQIGIFDTRI